MRRTGLLTADDLLRMPEDGFWYELVAGRLVKMSLPGAAHWVCAGRLHLALGQHVHANGLGLVGPQDSGFKLASNPDTVRGVDVAFVARERVPKEGIPWGYWDGASDLAVEVISPNDRLRAVEVKVREYLAAGAREVWVVHPRRRTVTIHGRGAAPVTLREHDTLDGRDVVPGFRYALSELFEGLRRRAPRVNPA